MWRTFESGDRRALGSCAGLIGPLIHRPWLDATARKRRMPPTVAIAEAAMIPAVNEVKAPDGAAALTSLRCLRMAIQARDTFPCAENALARDSAALALIKVAGISPELEVLRIIPGGRP
jgi:hypothetical protein